MDAVYIMSVSAEGLCQIKTSFLYIT